MCSLRSFSLMKTFKGIRVIAPREFELLLMVENGLCLF